MGQLVRMPTRRIKITKICVPFNATINIVPSFSCYQICTYKKKNLTKSYIEYDLVIIR